MSSRTTSSWPSTSNFTTGARLLSKSTTRNMWARRKKLLWAQPQMGQVAELMMTVAKSRDHLWDNKSMDHSVTNPQQAPPIGQLHLVPILVVELYPPCQLWRPCLPWNQGQGSQLNIQDLQGQTFPPLWDNIPHPYHSPQTRSDQWLFSFNNNREGLF